MFSIEEAFAQKFAFQGWRGGGLGEGVVVVQICNIRAMDMYSFGSVLTVLKLCHACVLECFTH